MWIGSQSYPTVTPILFFGYAGNADLNARASGRDRTPALKSLSRSSLGLTRYEDDAVIHGQRYGFKIACDFNGDPGVNVVAPSSTVACSTPGSAHLQTPGGTFYSGGLS